MLPEVTCRLGWLLVVLALEVLAARSTELEGQPGQQSETLSKNKMPLSYGVRLRLIRFLSAPSCRLGTASEGALTCDYKSVLTS